MRRKIIILEWACLLIFNFTNCRRDTSIMSPGWYHTLNINAKPTNIQSFDAYSDENLVILYWITGRPLPDPLSPPPPKVDIVKLYFSKEGPDDGFVQVCESQKEGNDSISVSKLSPNTNYFFRIAAFSSNDSLIGVSHPLMVSLGKTNDEYHSITTPNRDSPSDFSKLSWASNSDKLAFVASNESGSQNIYSLETNSLVTNQLTNFKADNHRIGSIAYSPDGNAIAFCYSPSQVFFEIKYQIWILNINFMKMDPITAGRVDADPVWLSNNKILFCKGTYEAPNIPELYFVDVYDKKESAITNDQKIYKYTPSFSPLNSQIVYSGATSSKRNLYTISTTGANNSRLTGSDYWNDINPSWSINGDKIFFASDRSGHYEMWSYDLTTEEYCQITHGLEKGVNRYDGKIDPTKKFIAIIEQKLGENYSQLKLLHFR